MAVVSLSVDQEDALHRMKIGCILNGGVGSGKSRTAIAYYYTKCGGEISTTEYSKMTNPRDLYIITTARKRDTMEWESELSNFYLSTNPEKSIYKNKVVVDSWNNIKKYVDIKDAFFIFDEQRVVGYGVWTKSFLKIASKNRWILLSATPGDTWMDYVPVFIANGFFKNKADFIKKHVVYSRFTSFLKVDRYINEARLLKMRDHILVNMDYKRETIAHHETVIVNYDKNLYDYVVRNRWNIFKDKPIENANEYCFTLRQIVNSSIDRQSQLLDIVKLRKKVIIFYSYNYELDILRKIFGDISYPIAEWDGHKHEPVPTGDHWVYLVQYTAGAEGWNCITTDTVVFYSQSYSYKIMVQAAGRIDRRNTPYRDLYYYHLRSNSKIDNAINKTLKRKKQFSEKGFAPDFTKETIPTKPAPIQLSLFDENLNPIDFTSEKTKNEKINLGNGQFEYDGIKGYYSWLDPNNSYYDEKAAKREAETHEIEEDMKHIFSNKKEGEII